MTIEELIKELEKVRDYYGSDIKVFKLRKGCHIPVAKVKVYRPLHSQDPNGGWNKDNIIIL